VLVRLSGRALVEHVLDTLSGLPGCRTVVVVGHGKEAVIAALDGRALEFADQGEPRGTGHAVLTAGRMLADHVGPVLVLSGDVPGVTLVTLERLLAAVRAGSAAALLTARLDEGGAYGRIVRRSDGTVAAIVEAADAGPETLAIREINVGAYVFRAPEVFAILEALRPDNAQHEIYLTDVIRELVEGGERVAGIEVGDAIEAAGVNTPQELDQLERWWLSARGQASGGRT
jgi:bifunctional UDP-N-acetylglucosamine pyrophosphorylase/glucosamine-1-phosphate N-acetyltransferase